MRKIVYHVIINPKTFQPEIVMQQKGDNGEVITLYHAHTVPIPPDEVPKYTANDLAKIGFCNKKLAEQGQDPLTDEESDFMLDPVAFGEKRIAALATEMEDLEVLRRMAGCAMEKVVKQAT
tara:strand:- start:292 stop:654 length:363 start_codon:yes stop_codon:yes gene_type:complete